MIKRNMIVVGDVVEWKGDYADGPCHYLLQELTCKTERFCIWNALNLTRGTKEIIEMNRFNARLWRRHGSRKR